MIRFSTLLLCYLCACSNPFVNKNAQIVFSTREIDLGNLSANDTIKCHFDFHNPGKYPLIIKEVKTSCRCIASEWPRKSVDPGDHEKIKIKLKNSEEGIFIQYIQVYFNGDYSPVILIIKGKVINS